MIAGMASAIDTRVAADLITTQVDGQVRSRAEQRQSASSEPCEPSVGQADVGRPTRTASPSASSEARHRVGLRRVDGHAGQRRSRHRGRAAPQRRHDPAPHLPVGAVPGLHRRAWPSPAGGPGQPPPAAVGQRARRRPVPRADADQRAQFHHRRREPGRPGRFGAAAAMSISARSAAVAGSRGSSTPRTTRDSTRRTLVSTTGVRAPNAKAATARAVYSPMPGSASSSSTESGTTPPCSIGDRGGGGVQPQRPARVAEPSPGPDRGGGGVGGQIRRASASGAASRSIHRQHPDHRRLLQHHLADQHRPRRRRRVAATAGRGRARSKNSISRSASSGVRSRPTRRVVAARADAIATLALPASSVAPGRAIGGHRLGHHDPCRTRRGRRRCRVELPGGRVAVDEDLLQQTGVDVEDEAADRVVVQQER